MGYILWRDYYLNGHHHEQVWKTGSSEFEIRGYGPRGGPYRRPVSISELCRMSNDVPWLPARA